MKITPVLPVLVAALVAPIGCSQPPRSAAAAFNVRTVAVEPLAAAARGSGPAYLALIRGETETSLSFKVSGQVVHIGPPDETEDWKEGTPVAAGTILAQLDPANFQSAAASARARAELARATFQRASELFAAGGLSKNEFEASQTQRQTAEAELAQAEQNLRDATLRAPYDGVVLGRSVKTGEFAAAGRAVLRLGDLRRVAIEVGVPDTRLAQLAIGQSHPVRVAAFDGEDFAGVISEIGTAAAENSRLFRIVLKVDNRAGRLKSGMTATVRLGTAPGAIDRGVVVPLSALVAASRSATGSAVFVIGPDNRAHERTIKTADIVASSIVVTDGLRAGDRVVTLGAGQLFDGAAVKALLSVQ